MTQPTKEGIDFFLEFVSVPNNSFPWEFIPEVGGNWLECSLMASNVRGWNLELPKQLYGEILI